MSFDDQERIARKLRDRRPLNDDDHIAVQRAWFNDSPQEAARIRSRLKDPRYLAAMRRAINIQRVKRGQPFISDQEWGRVLWIMTNSVL